MDNKMTQNYRKRAEEFWNSYGVKIPTERLEREFKEVAQEARREENEACAQVASLYIINKGELHPDIPFEKTSENAKAIAHQACQYVREAIRSRMEVKNG